MSDIFISYASQDRPKAQVLAEALVQQGWSVWWDRTIPSGKRFDQVIQEALAAARCVLVLWSRQSIASDWVLEEAEEGRKRHILVPVRIDNVPPPMGFRRIQAADLTNWDGTGTSPLFQRLVADIGAILGPPVKTEAGGVALADTKEAGAEVVEQERKPPPAPKPPPPEPPVQPPRPPRPPPWPKLLPWFIGTLLVVMVVAFWPFREPEQIPREEAPPTLPPKSVPQKEIPEKIVKPPTAAKKAPKTPSPPALKSVQKEIPKKIVRPPTPPKITPRKYTKPPRGMAVIPAGEFWMGCNEKVDKKCDNDEKPYDDKVNLDAFYIDTHEVTVADYRKCVEAGKCSSDGLTRWGKCNWDTPGRGDHPVNCVGWNQANTYCAWAGKRLPTEAEWEKAARGNGGRIYPWGDKWDSSRANVRTRGTVSVGSYPSGASPYGVYDMAGNVWEWTSSLYKSYPYKADDGREGPKNKGYRVLRGGSWHGTAGLARASRRLRFDPDFGRGAVGFRCAKTP